MNAAVLQQRRFSPRALPERRVFISGPPGRVSDSITIFSDEFPYMTAMSLPDSKAEHTAGLIQQLRLYTGTALLGSVVCGLAFGWWEHREIAQWIGAGVAMLAYALLGRRRHDD